MLTVLIPVTGAHQDWPATTCKVDAGLAVACELRHGQCRDFAVLPLSDSAVRIGGYWMRGDFFWLRTERGVLKEVLGIRARTFQDDGRVILQKEEPRAHVWLKFPGTAKNSQKSGDATICAESAALSI